MDSTKTGNQAGMQQGNMQGQDGFPIDNHTYNLMQALVSKCESIEAYRKYMKDGNHQVFQELMQNDQQHAKRLIGELKQALQRY